MAWPSRARRRSGRNSTQESVSARAWQTRSRSISVACIVLALVAACATVMIIAFGTPAAPVQWWLAVQLAACVPALVLGLLVSRKASVGVVGALLSIAGLVPVILGVVDALDSAVPANSALA